MSRRLRRSLVLTILLALLLALSGAASPTGAAVPIGPVGNPTNTKLAGIDVDTTTIPQLEQLMNSHRLNSVDLTNFYLRRIRQRETARPVCDKIDLRQVLQWIGLLCDRIHTADRRDQNNNS